MNILLTGITGLVGASVVTAILRKHPDYRIVAICRGNSAQTAQQRTELILKSQCDFDGDPESYDSIISRVTVIQGDVTKMPFDEIAKYAPYDVMFHCAADVNLGKDPEGKTYATNMNGTLQAVEVLQRFNIPSFHYVSTAYVAGKCEGRVMEDTMPATDWVNSYERSKYNAEKYVRDTVKVPYTIYRPSIIVGRRSDGVIRKPLAFYRILEFFGRLKSNRAMKAGVPANKPLEINLRVASPKSELIYFVPVDYVQYAISNLFEVPQKNRTYHITGDSPVSTDMIKVAVRDLLQTTGLDLVETIDNPTRDEILVSRMIEDLIPYFSTQIIFDNSNVYEDLGAEALNWKQDIRFLKRMAYSYFKQEYPQVVEGMAMPE